MFVSRFPPLIGLVIAASLSAVSSSSTNEEKVKLDASGSRFTVFLREVAWVTTAEDDVVVQSAWKAVVDVAVPGSVDFFLLALATWAFQVCIFPIWLLLGALRLK